MDITYVNHSTHYEEEHKGMITYIITTMNINSEVKPAIIKTNGSSQELKLLPNGTDTSLENRELWRIAEESNISII